MPIRADEKLAKAEIYQDVVMVELYKRGIVLNAFTSYHFQVKSGENMMGVEIKRDNLWRKSGNFYIETAEKHNVNGNFVPSGIMRQDNTWLYVIGDERTFYVLPKKALVEMASICKTVETPSSQGYLMTKAMVERYSLMKIETEREIGA